MPGFWLPLGLAFVAEVTFWQNFNIYGIHLPLTLLVLITLHYQQWASRDQRLLLGGIFGYAIDLLTASVAASLALGYILVMALLELSTRNRIPPSRLRRLLVIGGVLLVYWLIVNFSWGVAASALLAKQLVTYLLVSMVGFMVLQFLLRILGRRL